MIESNGDDEGLEAIVSEASGTALKHAPAGLAHHQAVHQLSKLYQCEPTWDAIKAYRIANGFNKLTERCFEASGIECILMDDLFSTPEKVAYPYQWHDSLTISKTKRIVRIESLAEEIAKSMKVADIRQFTQSYLRVLVDSAKRPEVVGFKSVICYRTGLDIAVTTKEKLDSRTDSFVAYLENGNKTGNWRLASKPLNDMITNLAIHVAGEVGIPIQFHTGLGDSDIRLVKANPAYMQGVIEAYPRTKFVLLHSAYPYTREAGYLTTIYDNVYLDCNILYCGIDELVGEVFPMLSPDGQRSVLRQVMELCPTDKILFVSSNPYLANR